MTTRDEGGNDRFREELEREAPAIYAWASATLARFRAANDAADFAQEVILRALRAHDANSAKIKNHRAWFFAIARRTLLEWVRAGAERRALGLGVGGDGNDLDEHVRVASGVSRRVARSDQVNKLLEVVRGFDETDQRIIVEYLIEGRSSEQVAEVVGLSAGAVRQAASRIRAELAVRAPFAADYFND